MPTPPMCKLCEKRHWTYEPHKLASNKDSEHLTASNGGDNASNNRSVNERDSAEVPNGVVVASVGGENSQRVEASTASRTSPAGERKGLKQRWSRDSYNAYMKEYMKKRRSRA